MRARILLCLLLGTTAAWAGPGGGGVAMHGISAPVLSPDGARVAFEWLDDLWLADSDGGIATRIVAGPGRDAYPRFSPDGTRLVFSSERSGRMQLHSVALAGGPVLRHSFHSEGNELECLSPDGRFAMVRGIRERAGPRATLLMEIDLTTERRERRIFEATGHSPAWSPDGRTLLFCRGGEQLHRQGYRGSRASRIWSFEPHGRVFRCETPGDFEARSPLWRRDGSGFYYVSNEDGTANLWRMTRPGGETRRLTSYRGEGVTSPDLSADGSTLVFRVGSAVFRWRPELEEEPQRVSFQTREALAETGVDTHRATGCEDCAFTPDATAVVASIAGELWWISALGTPARRLSETAAAEEGPCFDAAGEWLYFLRDDGLEAQCCRARMHDGRLGEVVPLVGGPRSKSKLKPSPDGSRIAWIEGTGDLLVAAADGSRVRRVFPCWDKPDYEWSPDGHWLVVAAEDAASNRDLLLVDPEGKRPPLNLTRHPGFEGTPRWSPDGRRIAFTARRDASGETALWLIDFGARAPAPDASEAFLLGAGSRATRIPTRGIEPKRLCWRPDGKTLLFQSRNASSRRLYALEPGKDPQGIAKARGVPLGWSRDGAFAWRVDRRPELLSASGTRAFPIDLEVRRPRDEVLRLAFRRIWRTLGERFHDPHLHGRDWQALRLAYEPQAVAARSSRQFDAVVSRLFGELNASHLSFLRDPWPEEREPAGRRIPRTAHCGLGFDDRAADPNGPLVIASLLAGSPVSATPEPPRPGEVVLRIAGEVVDHGSPLHRFLDDAEGKTLPFVLRAADGRERTVEVRCISYGEARRLDRAARETTAAARVAALAPGTAYLKVRDMGRAALDELTLAIHRLPAGTRGLVLDLRDNGGGREADRMLGLFHPLVHSTTVPRDGPRGYPLDRRGFPVWEGPMVVLCNANTFSNAEIFCHAMLQSRRAPLVGTTTAGGVISAVSVRIPDAGSLQVPFRSWFGVGDGRSLDLNGATPDHPVGLGPADEDEGSDPPLAKAIELLR